MIAINRKTVRISLVAVLLLLIAASHFGPLAGITFIFTLDQSGSVPVWFESFLYLICAGLLALAAFSRKAANQAGGWRWGVFSLFMLYLSINSSAEINRRVVGKLTRWTWGIGGSFFDLMIFLLLAATLIVILWPELSRLPACIRWEMFLAGLVFGIGAIVVDDLGDLLFQGSNEWFYMIESLFELSAFIILIDALIAYLAEESGTITLNFRNATPDTPEEGG